MRMFALPALLVLMVAPANTSSAATAQAEPVVPSRQETAPSSAPISTGMPAAEATALANQWVIAQNAGPAILEMANPAPRVFSGGWRLEGVSVRVVSADLHYRNQKKQDAFVALVHPSAATNALATTDRFALVVIEGKRPPPAALVQALVSRIRTQESRFTWTQRVPTGAVPIDPLNQAAFLMADPDLSALLVKARKAAQAGDKESAMEGARKLASSPDPDARRAAAAIMRMIGNAADAAKLLKETIATSGEGPAGMHLRIEMAASLELDGKPADAEPVLVELAGKFSRIYGDPRCARADALSVLLQDGLASQVASIADQGPLSLAPASARPGAAAPALPRCVHLFFIKAAAAAADNDGVDAAATRALAAYPDDPDMLFLWGAYHYKHHNLDKSLIAWDRLAPKHPDYPTLLGQYGTAYLVADRLNAESLQRHLEKAKADPDDVIAPFLAGLGLYYQKDFQGVIPLLTRAVNAVPAEPRAAMYLAMAHYFVGNKDKALKMLEDLEPHAYREPDINYCRSLVYRDFDLPRAIREMEIFLEVFEGESRLRFGEHKVIKARSDLERMRRGEIPEVTLPQPDSETP